MSFYTKTISGALVGLGSGISMISKSSCTKIAGSTVLGAVIGAKAHYFQDDKCSSFIEKLQSSVLNESYWISKFMSSIVGGITAAALWYNDYPIKTIALSTVIAAGVTEAISWPFTVIETFSANLPIIATEEFIVNPINRILNIKKTSLTEEIELDQDFCHESMEFAAIE